MKVNIKPYIDHKTVMGFLYFDVYDTTLEKMRKSLKKKNEDFYKKYNLKEKLTPVSYEKFSDLWILYPVKFYDKVKMKINAFREDRRINVKIEEHDSWSLDNTLAHIILPALKQLKAAKQGSPNVDDDDVPEDLKSTSAPSIDKDMGEVDDNFFKRWDYVLDQMIWSFENIVDDDWSSQFHTTGDDYEMKSIPMVMDENGEFKEVDDDDDATMFEMRFSGERSFDAEGYKAYDDRIDNGLRLFGKYYRSLWS